MVTFSRVMQMVSIIALLLLQPGVTRGQESLTLPDCIEQALLHNPLVQRSERQLAMSELQTRQASSSLLPSVSLSGQFSRYTSVSPQRLLNPATNQIVEGSATANTSMSYYSGLSISQPLFNRAITSLYSQAVASEEISRATNDLQRQQTILQVYQAYYGLLRAERNLVVARTDLEYNQELLRQVNTLHSLGNRARVDVLRQESAVAQSEQRLISAVNDRARGMAELNYLMGLSPIDDLSIVDDLGFEPQRTEVEAALEMALRDHPSLRQAVLGITVAETGLQSAKAARVPSMSLSGNYSWRGSSYTDFTDAFSKDYTWSVGVGLYVPIFDRLQTKLGVQRARIDLEGARADRAATELGIERDVHAAVLELQEAEQMLQTAQRAVTLSEEALKLSRERYRLGAGSLLEVNASQYDLVNAQYQEVQALFTLKVATAGLEFAMGRLLTGTLLERNS